MSNRGRKPSLEITNELLIEIEELAGKGLTQKQISAYYGITPVTWHKMKKKHSEIRISYKKGKSKTIAFVTGKLMDKIRKGNSACIMFYLKTQAGWREKSSSGDDNNVKSKKTLLKIETDDPIEAAKIYQQIMTGSQ